MSDPTATQEQAAMFTSVLVANRGEIAIRVFRSLREMGIRTIAIYSDADRDSLHVSCADEAWSIGGQLASESYLRGDRVLEIAQRAGASAIHPGYGFLAENAQFARDCASAGIVFIGPTPDAIDEMGSKTRSRELMRAAGVAIVPGTTDPLTTLEEVTAAAHDVGYPIAVKARSGGGGKGFRVALTQDEVAAAFEGATGEGVRYFSDPAVYIERYLPNPRHVEVQILADHHGSIVHLGERDCTVQRRHQKLIEESPCPVATPELRASLTDIALGAARAVGYTSAGTIECLMDQEGNAYFLEMNTRVQVEHTVTELVTGIDIVAEQVRIAAGLPLSFTQGDVSFRGHAIECRINAEDAREDFRPASGTITQWSEPGGIGVRVDSGVRAGSIVSPYYDTLLAKLIAHAPTRDGARARMLRALSEFHVQGLTTLIDFHSTAIASDEFASAGACRDLVANPGAHMPSADVEGGAALQVGAPRHAPTGLPLVGRSRIGEIDGRRVDVLVYDSEFGTPIAPPIRERQASSNGADGSATAPIPGNVLSIKVAAGQIVQSGDVLCILEAMKMENEIQASIDGTIAEIAVEPGESVAAGQLLMRVLPG